MGIFTLVYRNLRNKSLSSLLTMFSVALGVILLLTILIISSGLEEGIINSSRDYDLVVGAPGSPTQLTLSTLFHYEEPPGNIDYQIFEEFKADQRLKKATPLALGDSYLDYRIVGTDYTYFVDDKEELDESLIAGSFMEEVGDAVIGIQVAQEAGLELGSTFQGVHGINGGAGGHLHDEVTYEVVGVLDRGQGVDDRIIFTTIESVWNAHHVEATHFPFDEESNIDSAHSHDGHSHDEHFYYDGLELSAILVQTTDLQALSSLKNELNNREDYSLQAAYIPSVLRSLLEVVNQGTMVVNILALITLIVALSSVLISLLGLTSQKRGELAILRMLGASKFKVLLTVFLEALVIIILGLILGTIGGYLLSYLLSAYLETTTGISINVLRFWPQQDMLLGGLFLLGLGASLIPALSIYNDEAMQFFE